MNRYEAINVPTGLRRFQQTRQMHFITFSCYRRQPKLSIPNVRDAFAHLLEQTRRAYQFCVAGYVVRGAGPRTVFPQPIQPRPWVPYV